MEGRAMRIDPEKLVASEPAADPGRTETPDEAVIAARAYALWQDRGCPIGSPREDWYRAEQELKSRLVRAA